MTERGYARIEKARVGFRVHFVPDDGMGVGPDPWRLTLPGAQKLARSMVYPEPERPRVIEIVGVPPPPQRPKK